jgi:precorrin-6Y C5,15-methyltransferase (decarboxylating)
VTGSGRGRADPGEGRASGVVDVVGTHGGQVFGPAAAALAGADLVVGSARQLAATGSARRAGAETVTLAGPIRPVLETVREAADAGRAVCVLASGDPGFFGIVRLAAEALGGARLRVHPAPSSVSLAFARLGRSWDDAAVVSAHGRDLADAVGAVRRSPAPAVAILTSPDNPPEALAAALIDAGEPAGRPVSAWVASRLGEPEETVTGGDLAAVAAGVHDPMSVLVLTGRAPSPQGPSLGWGLPEADFEHRSGMITKAEVRAVVLGKLRLPGTGVLWDLGAGSGSVGIEAARIRPGLAVHAVERDPAAAETIRANAARHGVPVTVRVGDAPGALAGLPDPDRVFVGGGGLEVLDAALTRLRPGGTVVATYAVLDRAAAAAARLGDLVQLSISRAVPTGELGVRLRAENPVFVCWGGRR